MQCNSSGSKCLSSFDPRRQLKSFREIIQDYISGRRPIVQREFERLRSIKDHSDLIRVASYTLQSGDKRSSHHYRKSSLLLDEIHRRLRSKRAFIMKLTSFDTVYDLLSELIGKLQGVGPLYLYDTSLVLCAGRGYLPDKIYLHSGTTIGARALELKTNRDWITRQELPKEFQHLAAFELEDILCIYGDDLKRIVKHSTKHSKEKE